METEDLYRECDQAGVRVFHTALPSIKGVANSKGFIVLDKDLRGVAEKEALAHEMGHLETGACYTLNAPAWAQKKAENKASKWAYRKLIPRQQLRTAMMSGIIAPYELAEHFGVSEKFIKRAMIYYLSS